MQPEKYATDNAKDNPKDSLTAVSIAPASELDLPITEPALAIVSPSIASPMPWSKSEALNRLGENEDLLHEMCGIFLTASANLLETLRDAVAKGESEAVMRAAHSLKGEASYFSAPAAVEAARRLEDIGHEHDLSRAPEALATLEREMTFLWRALREFAGIEP